MKIKRTIYIIICLIMIFSAFSGCSQKETEGNDKISIVATLFPQYDFARAIAKDKCEIKLLLTPGTESHSFDPTPQDIINIKNSDLFIYTGKNMETWADRVISSVTESEVFVLDVSENVSLKKSEDNHKEHAGKDDLQFDPHIWTSPVNAKIMVDNITNALCNVDPENSGFYKNNSEEYKKELDLLDEEFRQTVEHGKRRKIVFGSRFAMLYFAEEYSLDWVSAYDSCSSESEPGIQAVAELINLVKNENIPVIYYEELSEPQIARRISSDTGAEMLVFYSCHNISKDDFENGLTYLDLMNKNAENLKKGLN